MTNLKEKLNALKQVREKARDAGEWHVEDREIYGQEAPDKIINNLMMISEGCIGSAHFAYDEDAEFISTAANEWTSLIEALEESVAMFELITSTTGDDKFVAREALIKIDTLLSRKDDK